MSISKTKAIIFDIDGVLLNSNPAHYKSWVIAGREDGVEFSPELFQETFGQTSRSIIREHWNRPMTEEEVRVIDERKETLYRECVSELVKPIPGAFELLKLLNERGYPLGIGSSGPGINVDYVLDYFDLWRYVGAVVSGTDVVNGKPSPDIFLKVAEKLGIVPERCLIIDDSRSGILAGVAAGMKTVGFFSEGHRPDEYEKADLVVHSFAELSPERLEKLW